MYFTNPNCCTHKLTSRCLSHTLIAGTVYTILILHSAMKCPLISQNSYIHSFAVCLYYILYLPLGFNFKILEFKMNFKILSTVNPERIASVIFNDFINPATLTSLYDNDFSNATRVLHAHAHNVAH